MNDGQLGFYCIIHQYSIISLNLNIKTHFIFAVRFPGLKPKSFVRFRFSSDFISRAYVCILLNNEFPV